MLSGISTIDILNHRKKHQIRSISTLCSRMKRIIHLSWTPGCCRSDILKGYIGLDSSRPVEDLEGLSSSPIQPKSYIFSRRPVDMVFFR